MSCYEVPSVAPVSKHGGAYVSECCQAFWGADEQKMQKAPAAADQHPRAYLKEANRASLKGTYV